MSDYYTNENPPVRVKLLNDAADLIVGDRQKDYGPPDENLKRIASLWSIQIAAKLKEDLTATDIAALMMQLKLARLINSPTEDSFKDIAGYAGIGWESVVIEEAKKRHPSTSTIAPAFLTASILPEDMEILPLKDEESK